MGLRFPNPVSFKKRSTGSLSIHYVYINIHIYIYMYVYVARHIQFFQAVSTNTPKKSFDLSLVSTKKTLRCLDCRFHPLSLQPSTQEASERSVKGGPCQLCGQLLQQWHLSLACENRQGNDVTHTIHGTIVYLIYLPFPRTSFRFTSSHPERDKSKVILHGLERHPAVKLTYWRWK